MEANDHNVFNSLMRCEKNPNYAKSEFKNVL